MTTKKKVVDKTPKEKITETYQHWNGERYEIRTRTK